MMETEWVIGLVLFGLHVVVQGITSVASSIVVRSAARASIKMQEAALAEMQCERSA